MLKSTSNCRNEDTRYIIMKTMLPLSHHKNGLVATEAVGYMM